MDVRWFQTISICRFNCCFGRDLLDSRLVVIWDLNHVTWRRHGMETIPALLALCEGNPPLSGFPQQGPVELRPGGRINIRMSSYLYKKYHCGDKTILRPSYLHNGISYTDKLSSLYWIGPLVFCSYHKKTGWTNVELWVFWEAMTHKWWQCKCRDLNHVICETGYMAHYNSTSKTALQGRGWIWQSIGTSL